MSTLSVMVSLDAGEEERALVRETLGDRAEVVFRADLDEGARAKALADSDVLVAFNPGMELTDDELEALSRVRLLQLLSAGWDHVDFSRLPASTQVASNAGAYAEPMAEHVLAMALALAKRLREGHAELARGEFDQFVMSRSLRGMDVAILGFGGIGKAVARLLAPFEVRVHAVNTSGHTDAEVASCATLDDLERVLRLADLIVVSLPLTRTTKGLIGARELGWLKEETILVNVARGEILDQDALWAHLKDHPGVLVGIDAWWVEPLRHGRFELGHPFFELPNFLGSPHNSAMVPGFAKEALRRALENVVRFAEGRPLVGLVDRREAPGR